MTPSRFRQFEAFRAVLRSGSVSRAAEALSLSQPAVTKLLRALEDETGLVLFDRTRRRLVPTPEASQCEEAVERLFAAADRLDRTVYDMRDVGTGALRVAAMPLLGARLIPQLLARFAQQMGKQGEKPVRVSLNVANSRDVHDIVQAGDLDIGFALAFGGASTPAAAPPILLPALLALPRGHKLAHRAMVALGELEGLPIAR